MAYFDLTALKGLILYKISLFGNSPVLKLEIAKTEKNNLPASHTMFSSGNRH